MTTNLAVKLNMKPGMRIRVIGKPPDVDLSGLALTASKGDGVIAFVKKLGDVDRNCKTVFEAARGDRLAWIAYPKAGQLGTDLNRDILWRHVLKHGIQGVRQVAIDNVWSAMRFRPKK